MAEAETILQPSLHTVEEYVQLVLDEVDSRGIDVSDLQDDFDRGAEDFYGEIADEALGRLTGGGYAWIEVDDTLLIMPHGEDLPTDWQE